MPDNTPQGASNITPTQTSTPTATSQLSTTSPEIGNSVPSATTQTSSTSTSGSDNSTSSIHEGEDLFEYVASLSQLDLLETIAFNDGMRRKISCFFIDKGTMSPSSCFHYIYGKEVNALGISQSVTKFGLTGTVEIEDVFGSLTSVVEGQSNFYFVVSIFEITKEFDELKDGKSIKNQKGYMLQPFIFEIDEVDIISPDGAPSKVYRLTLSDVLSSTLKKVSYGNLLLQYPSFINSTNFVELYKTLLEYGATIINLNHNKKYKIDYTIEYVDDVTDSINELLKAVILKDLPISMTCYDLLNHIYNHAAREIEPPSNFSGEKVGNILLPLLVQDEFPEVSGAYPKLFNRKISKELLKDLSFSGENNTTSATLIKRIYAGKCILMPFALAFPPSGDTSYIYENINPARDGSGNLQESETIYAPMNGVVISNISENADVVSPNKVTGRIWKNLALISDTPGGAANLLVYFNWIYEYYKAAFLNNCDTIISRKAGKKMTPATDPHFHRMEVANLTGGDKETFAKINANTIVLKSTDTIKEALYYVGRAIKSYIFMNSVFGFKINGSALRHPGEIIKINSSAYEKDDNTSTGTVGGIEGNMTGFVMAYTTGVNHIFRGGTYENLIFASKVCNIR